MKVIDKQRFLMNVDIKPYINIQLLPDYGYFRLFYVDNDDPFNVKVAYTPITRRVLEQNGLTLETVNLSIRDVRGRTIVEKFKMHLEHIYGEEL